MGLSLKLHTQEDNCLETENAEWLHDDGLMLLSIVSLIFTNINQLVIFSPPEIMKYLNIL
jgi:hypothetical protein